MSLQDIMQANKNINERELKRSEFELDDIMDRVEGELKLETIASSELPKSQKRDLDDILSSYLHVKSNDASELDVVPLSSLPPNEQDLNADD